LWWNDQNYINCGLWTDICELTTANCYNKSSGPRAASLLEFVILQKLLLALFLSVAIHLSAQQAAPSTSADSPDTLLFQTTQAWSPEINLNAGMVLAYGIDDTLPARMASWRAHGYHTAVMTGVAWGRYSSYLRGDFDGQPHWDETQQESSGTLILHDDRTVPYISPTPAYARYLSEGVLKALDAGAEAVYLEEPEFWARAGWSPAFRHSWQQYYGEPWQAPDASPAAQYRASELKYRLYRDALRQVFDAVRQWGAAHGKLIPCYVATHSLINYAQWQIVSPESSLLAVGADGYIAQVWTGTARTPNTWRGQTAQRSFPAAFLEYGALQNLARSSGKKIWYLDDPIEDNPDHSWLDYRTNWESILTASLLQSEVARYEVTPWPERIFPATSLYPDSEPSAANPHPTRVAIPAEYKTELQTVFHALSELPTIHDSEWIHSGSEGVGVLVSDTMLFERAQPKPSDDRLGNFFGLALPPLMRGIPVEPVQMESLTAASHPLDLAHYKFLLLSSEGQKPPTAEFDTKLAEWVRKGGILLLIDDQKDPYNAIPGWWNSGQMHFASPTAHLASLLGIAADHAAITSFGSGIVAVLPTSPSQLSRSPEGDAALMQLLNDAARAGHKTLATSSAMVLRRGPYLVAAGLETPPSAQPVTLRGRFVNLFDPTLALRHNLTLTPESRLFLLDLDQLPAQSTARILAITGSVSELRSTDHELSFSLSGLESSTAVMRIALPGHPRSLTIDGHPAHFTTAERTLFASFPLKATPQKITLRY